MGKTLKFYQSFSFNKRLSYDTLAFRFFTPLDGPKATSSQLTSGQPVQMGQQRLATLTSQTFKANTQLQVELTDLPLPPDRGVIAVRNSILKISIFLLTLGGLIFLGFYLHRKNKTLSLGNTFATSEAGTVNQKTTLDDTLEIDKERRRLLYKLARLDITYDKGAFADGESAYQRQRQELKVQLIETWQGQVSKEELNVIAGN